MSRIYLDGQGWIETGNLNAQEIQNMIQANIDYGYTNPNDSTPPPADMSPDQTLAPSNSQSLGVNPGQLHSGLHQIFNHHDDDAFIQWPAWQSMGLMSGMGTGTGVSTIGPDNQYRWGGTGPTPSPYGVNQQGVPYAGPVSAGENTGASGGGGGFGMAVAGGPGSGGFGGYGTPGGRIDQFLRYHS